jgi:uncharacterized protein with PQ loop repeat
LETFKKFISLDYRIWVAGILNVVAMVFQLAAVIQAGSTAGLSRAMLVIFLFVQLTFAQVGWRTNVMGQFWSMILSAVITTVVLVLTFVY